MKILFFILCLINSKEYVINNNNYLSSNEKTYNITINKTTYENDPIEGSKFVLLKNNKIVRRDIKTNNLGKFVIYGINNGIYTLIETTKLSWYKNSPERIIEVNNNNENIIIKSKKIKPSKIIIRNTNSINQLIKSSSFKIYKDNEEIGENNVSGLLPGKYIIKQVSIGKEYRINKKDIIININEGEEKIVEIKNYKKYVNFKKPLTFFFIISLIIIKKFI